MIQYKLLIKEKLPALIKKQQNQQQKSKQTKTEAVSKIQRLFEKQVLGNKNYVLIDVLFYRKPDEDDNKRMKQNII